MFTKQKYNRYYDSRKSDIVTNNRVFIKRIDLLKSLIFIIVLNTLLFCITFIYDTSYTLNIIVYITSFSFIISEFYYITKRINDIEYQSMLFANALKADTMLIAIVSDENELLYFELKDNLLLNDKLINKINYNFNDILSNLKVVDDEIRDGIKNALKQNILYKKDIYNEDKDKYYLLLFEPLIRPEKTFSLKICDATEVSIYRQLLNNHSISFYQTDKNKNIINSNDVFLNLLRKKTCNDIKCKIDDILVDHNTLYTDYGAKYNVSTTNIKANDRHSGYLECTLLTIKELIYEFIDFPIPMIYFNHNGKIIKQNKQFFNLIKNLDQSKNNNIFNIINTEITESLLIMKSDDSYKIEICIQNTISMSMNIKKIKQYYFAHFIDLTEYKEFEKRLNHSQKLSSIGNLAGGIAHDFNNILTAIVGSCELLLNMVSIDDERFIHISNIKEDTGRATSLVSQLLSFSRREVLDSKVYTIESLLSKVVVLCNRVIPANVSLNVEYKNTHNKIYVDKSRFEQVLLNMIINARDAIGDSIPGNIDIIVLNQNIDFSTKIHDKYPSNDSELIVPGQYLLIRIIDSGSGISKDNISKIFKPFFSTKEIMHGTGFGLSTADGIVRQFKGYIYYNSKEDNGSEFDIYIPIAYQSEVTIDAVKNNKKLYSMSFNSKYNNINILLVEDDNSVRKMCEKVLISRGFNIISTSDPREAIEMVNENIHLVLTDIIMPGMDGIEMIKCHILKKYPNIKVIYMSGYTCNTEIKENDFILKPFDWNILISKIANLCLN